MYAQENYRKVKEMIEKRRTAAIAESETRNIEVASLSDKIREIDKEMRGTGLLLFKAACSGEDIAPIRARNLELSKMRKAELVKLGLPEDYTEIHYTCPLCSDSGFVDTKMCSCVREMLVTENIRSSGMGKLIERQSFENFDLERYKNNPIHYSRMSHNFAIAKTYAENFSLDSEDMILMGKTGTGKTHITTAIAKRIIERGFEVLYDSAQNIVSAFEADRFKSGYGPYEPKADKYLECDLLILDDLGTEFSNQFTVSCLYNLLNTRKNKALPTIISTNLTNEGLSEKYEDRIYSRVIGAGTRMLIFVGEDMRINGETQYI